MRSIFTVVTNLPEDTSEITDRLAEYIVDMMIREYDSELIELLVKRLEEEVENEFNSIL